MNVLQFLISLRPAVPMLHRKDSTQLPMSNSEIRRAINDRAVRLNGDNDWKHDDEMPPMVWELVYFPKSDARRTTII